jgi:TonB-linked SusC/RagA family outer membrane protein
MKNKLPNGLPQMRWPYRKPLAVILVCATLGGGPVALAASMPHGLLVQQADIVVSGRVLDESKQPVPGVSVNITGTKIGTVTDSNGNYKLNVPEASAGKSLTFSYIGYSPQVVPIAGKTEITVTLVPDSKDLNEVVVVGYGTQSRVSLTGAVSQVSSKNIENKPVLNTLQALQGEAPNLTIQQSNLNPGSDVSINIRGVGTLGNNDPLVVIDGIIGGNINTLNPNDIASVSVLKDAGSAAIYGSRAANGVLLVTTKSGSLNQKPSLTYNTNFGFQDPRVLVHKVDAGENAEYKNQSLINAGLPVAYTPAQIQELQSQGRGTWDIEHLLKNAPQQSHNISINGGGPTSSYYLSAGMQDQKSNLIGNGGSGADFGYTKYNLRLNQTSQIGILKVNMILAYTKSRRKSNSVGDNNIFADANRVPINYSWLDDAGNYLTNPVASQYNEYGILEKGGFEQTDNDEIFGNLNGQVNITKDLKLTGVFGGTIANRGIFFKRSKVTYLPSGVYGDDLTVSDRNNKSLLMNTQLLLEYGKTIKDHTYKILLGASNENFSTRGFQLQKTLTDPILGTSTTGTLIDAINSTNSVGEQQRSLNSLFSRVNYAYKGRYLFEATVRNDVSSRFAKGNRSSIFPSVNLGWLISDEEFMQPLKNSISNVKLRTTYGILGNQNVGASLNNPDLGNFQYLTTYFNYASAYGYNNQPVGGAGFTLGNADLTWEKAATLNLGLDLGFFDNKLTASFDYFNKVTSDILQPRYDVPALFGAGLPDYNVAKVRNQGWEATIGYRLTTGAAEHSFSFNIADSKNKLLKLTGGTNEQIINQDVFQLIRRVGEPITQYYGYETNGYFQNAADVSSSPKPAGADVGPGDIKFKDRNNDGLIDDKDKTVLGNPFPRYTFGFTYRLNYKNFDFQVFVQGVGKRDAFLRGELVEPFHYNYGATVYDHMTDFWTPDNPDARYPRLAAVGSGSNTNNWRQGSDVYRFNAAYARLKNLNIGYTFPQQISRKAGMERLRISLIGQNLFTLTKLKFIDPETTEFGNNVSVSTGSNSARSYPLPVFYGAGLDITF